MGKIRAFIALNLGANVKSFLEGVINNLRDLLYYERIKWVRPQQLHLTLKFFEEVDTEILRQGFNDIRNYVKGIPCIDYRLSDSLGAFPNWRSPRVIWVGLEEIGNGHVYLSNLQTLIEETYRRYGIPKEGREFKPHITLGRVKTRLTPDSLGLLQGYRLEPISGIFSEMIAYRSQLTPSGPIYTPLEVAQFKEL